MTQSSGLGDEVGHIQRIKNGKKKKIGREEEDMKINVTFIFLGT